MPIITRAGKGEALEQDELDANIEILAGITPQAVAGARFVADGSDGGDYIRIAGYGHYSDDRVTSGTPAMDIVNGVRTQFVCNGARLIREKLPSDATLPLWSVSASKIVPIAAFDMMSLRMWFTAENYSGAAPYVVIELDLGGTDGIIFDQTISLVKGGGPQPINTSFITYAGPDFITNGGKFFLTYVGNGSVDIFKNSILVNRESKNYV